MSAPALLCIGGLDPSGGAGLLADVEAARTAGARPMAVLTAVTVQSAAGVRAVRTLDPALVVAQVEELLREDRPAAIKLGMLGTAEVALALARVLREAPPRVIDPVLRATSGAALFAGDAREAYAPLIEGATLVTPNLDEAAALCGLPEVASEEAMLEAARRLLAAGARAALVKGGHLAGDATDLFVEAGGAPRWLRAERIPGTRRGTGCRLASTAAAALALGAPLHRAVAVGKSAVLAYLRED